MSGSARLFLVHLVYTVPFDRVEPHLAAHRAYLDRLVEGGSLLLSGPLVPRTGGLLLMSAPDREALDGMLSGDPYARAGVARCEVMEFQPVKAGPPFAILLGKG